MRDVAGCPHRTKGTLEMLKYRNWCGLEYANGETGRNRGFPAATLKEGFVERVKCNG